MQKVVEISAEAIASLETGKRVEGTIRQDKQTGKLVFKHYVRQTPSRKHDTMIMELDHGWVRESVQRIKVYESIPKTLGNARVAGVLARDTCDAVEAIENHRIV